jgi:hypothetical protein
MTEIPKHHHIQQREIRALSPVLRMARFAELQARALALLVASPEGYRTFWQRNLRKRRIHASF